MILVSIPSVSAIAMRTLISSEEPSVSTRGAVELRKELEGLGAKWRSRANKGRELFSQGVTNEPTAIFVLDACADELSALLAKHAEGHPSEAELMLRREVWLLHGHQGLYGDDGEMQCAECNLDYKRAPVEGIVECIQALGLRKLAGADLKERTSVGEHDISVTIQGYKDAATLVEVLFQHGFRAIPQSASVEAGDAK